VRGAEDAGQVQSLGARFSHDLISLDYAATMGCRACGSSGGGCQFLGTAATSQVVAEALGLALPHSALAPSGEPVWVELARRSAAALQRLDILGISLGRILTAEAIEKRATRLCDGAGVHGRRRAGGDAAPPPAWACCTRGC
jgi:dihydroxyacid dehydratase/phosphogluconate dehydratase